MQALESKNWFLKNKSKLFDILKDKEYFYNKPFLKEYSSSDGTKKYKLTIMNCVKNSLVETPKIERSKNVNEEKLDNNLQRSRATIFELAFCNKWDYFFTGTLDKKKCNREDLKEFGLKFKNFIYHVNKNYNCKIQYLIIPELHDDLKSWHFHGFLQGVPEDRIKQFKIGDKMGKLIAEKVMNGEECYYWLDWSRSFGFNDLELIKSCEAVSKYVTKYVTKDLIHSVKELNAHTYYCSKGLKRALQVSTNKIDLRKMHSLKPDFENDYCSINWLTEEQYNSLLVSSNVNLQQTSELINSPIPL